MFLKVAIAVLAGLIGWRAWVAVADLREKRAARAAALEEAEASGHVSIPTGKYVAPPARLALPEPPATLAFIGPEGNRFVWLSQAARRSPGFPRLARQSTL